MIQNYKTFQPKLHETCFIAPGSAVIGEVAMGRNSSVWYNVVIRGDVAQIIIGENTNIQDGSILHCKTGITLQIGNNITVGHGAILHSCTIGDGSLIGMGAIVLDEARVGRNCIVAAGTLVTPRMVIPDGSLVMGHPGKVARSLTNAEIDGIQNSVKHYLTLALDYQQGDSMNK